MKQMSTKLSEIKLVGITALTNNAEQMNPLTAKISQTIQKYFQGGFAEKIVGRKKPGNTYCVYTDYESDFNGEYTYFIGEEVNSFQDVPEGMIQLTIPAQNYTKVTNEPGPMPAVCINMWQKIWLMTSKELGGEREYLADFELYDERASNPLLAQLDIFVGIKK